MPARFPFVLALVLLAGAPLIARAAEVAEGPGGSASPASTSPVFAAPSAAPSPSVRPWPPPVSEYPKMEDLVRRVRDNGQYANALSMARTLLALRVKALGPEHSDVVGNLSLIAGIHRRMRQFPEAEDHMQRALDMSKRVDGPASQNTAIMMDNFASLLSDKGDAKGAVELGRQALAIFEKTLGPDHGDLAICLDNLANFTGDAGDWAEARKLSERALAIRQKNLGEHADVATNLDNLGRIVHRLGDLKGATDLRRRALAMYEKTLGPDHPEVAVCLENYAIMLQEQDQLADAVTQRERALVICEKAFGVDSRETITATRNLILVCDRAKDPEALIRMRARRKASASPAASPAPSPEPAAR